MGGLIDKIGNAIAQNSHDSAGAVGHAFSGRVGDVGQHAVDNAVGYPHPGHPAPGVPGGLPVVPRPDAKGFMESMGGFQGAAPGGLRIDQKGMPAAPPPQWIYTPGQGATWGTPQREGTSGNYSFQPNAPGSQGFNNFKGNRF